MKICRVGAGVAAGVFLSRLAQQKLSPRKWLRQHADGTDVSLFGGLETAGAVAGASIALANTHLGQSSLLASSAGAVAGWIDDHFETSFAQKGKGFRGHLGALARGQLTSGMLKIIIIGAGAGASALILSSAAVQIPSSQTQIQVQNEMRRNSSLFGKNTAHTSNTSGVINTGNCGTGKNRKCGTKKYGASKSSKPRKYRTQKSLRKTLTASAFDTVIIAGSANFLNLLDLQPGRALKAGIIYALPAVFSHSTAVKTLGIGVIAASASALPQDLKGQTMLGDFGANSLGSALGVLNAATARSLPAKMLLATGLVALNLLSEKVSFSQIIQNNFLLRELDRCGRKS